MNPNWVMYCVLPVIVTDKISALLYQMAWRKARIVEQTKIALKVMSNVCSEKTKIMSQWDMLIIYSWQFNVNIVK